MNGVLRSALRGLLPSMFAAVASQVAAEEWTFGLSGFVFDPPDQALYVSPIVDADRGALHLEARYNYEDLETGSAFVGWNLASGHELVLNATPLFGLVLGGTNGVSLGAEIGVDWRSLAFYSESECVFDSDDSFLYTWDEATVAPSEWLRCGLVVQRTRAYETGLDLQRGLLIEVSHGPLSFGSYWFNPGREADRLLVFSVGYEF